MTACTKLACLSQLVAVIVGDSTTCYVVGGVAAYYAEHKGDIVYHKFVRVIDRQERQFTVGTALVNVECVKVIDRTAFEYISMA